MTALLLTGTHILAVLAGAWLHAKWQRTLPRNRVSEPDTAGRSFVKDRLGRLVEREGADA